MSTRSITIVYNSNKQPIVCMYRQCDGYPSGHGLNLANFLTPLSITNGIAQNAKMGESANGMGCLAAQMVAHFKKEVGEIYLHPTTPDVDYGQEYEYHVYNETVTMKGYQNFNGSWSDFKDYCSVDHDEDDEDE
jgi:hypothetical protein